MPQMYPSPFTNTFASSSSSHSKKSHYKSFHFPHFKMFSPHSSIIFDTVTPLGCHLKNKGIGLGTRFSKFDNKWVQSLWPQNSRRHIMSLICQLCALWGGSCTIYSISIETKEETLPSLLVARTRSLTHRRIWFFSDLGSCSSRLIMKSSMITILCLPIQAFLSPIHNCSLQYVRRPYSKYGTGLLYEDCCMTCQSKASPHSRSIRSLTLK